MEFWSPKVSWQLFLAVGLWEKRNSSFGYISAPSGWVGGHSQGRAGVGREKLWVVPFQEPARVCSLGNLQYSLCVRKNLLFPFFECFFFFFLLPPFLLYFLSFSLSPSPPPSFFPLCGKQKSPGQGSNSHHSSNNTGSLTAS